MAKVFSNPRHVRELERDIGKMALPKCQLCGGRGFTGTEVGVLKSGAPCHNKVACICIRSHQQYPFFERKWEVAQ